MLLKSLYYRKALKPLVPKYILQCRTCQQRNRHIVEYTNLHFHVQTTTMQFILMDLIGEF